MSELTPEQQKKQELYRDARFLDKYDDIWQSVGKCVFCDLNEKYVFFEENGVVMTISLYAYTDGHFMIVPRRHIRSAKDMTQAEWETVRKFMYIAKRLFKEVHGIKGMQLVQKDGTVAQSTVEHIHFHCIPFDDPNLSTWNFKKLDHTPLENVALYKKARKKIVTSSVKFDKKYHEPTALPIVCDAIAVNDKQEILFQERTPEHELQPNWLTLPGGVVHDFTKSLEEELVREIFEETGYEASPNDLRLIASQVDSITRKKRAEQLAVRYVATDTFVRNTYVVGGFDASQKLQAQDDAKELVWIPAKDIAGHERVSETTKQVITKALL